MDMGSVRASRGSVSSCALQPSYFQERLWFLTHLHPRLVDYCAACAVRHPEPVDVERLQAACEVLAARHGILRAKFPARAGGCTITVSDPFVPVVRVQTARGLSCDSEDTILDLLRANILGAFDLEKGPLFRVHILSTSSHGDYVAVVLHRLAGNEATARMLLEELVARYAAGFQDESCELSSAPPQFHEFATQQRANFPPDTPVPIPTPWRRVLDERPAKLGLPADSFRPAVKTYAGNSVVFEVPGSFAGTLSCGDGAGPEMPSILLSAFLVLLSRYTRQDDFMVGVRTTCALSPDAGGPLGPTDNYVPLYGVLPGNPTWEALTARVRSEWNEAMSSFSFPFERVLAEAQLERDTSHSPLFQAEFSYDEFSKAPASPDGIHTLLELPSRICMVDIGLHCRKLPGGWRCHLEYSADLFEEATVQRMARHFTTLLCDALAYPHRTVAELRLMDDEERKVVTKEFNRTQVDYLLSRRLHDLLDAQASATPERPAVQFGDSTLTYRQFTEHANQLAHRLLQHGVGPDILVGICLERSVELVLALHAVLRAGGAYVPLDPTYPKARLAGMVEDANPRLILAQPNTLHVLQDVTAPVLLVEPELARASHEPCSTPESGTTPDSLAYVIFTSGSTGRPKGAMNAHRGICNRLLWMQDAYGLDESDAVLQKTPFSFDVSVWEFFWPLMAGARLVVARSEGHKDPAYLASAICDSGITTIHFVPSMLRAFLDHPKSAACTGLTRVICSGEALPRDLQNRFHAALPAELHNLYGPTEAAVDVTAHACVPGAMETLVPIGRPIANTSIYIVDSRMEPTPVGVPGELCIGGVQVGLGYVNRPGLTAERFVADPFSGREGARLYRTGDLARFRPDGVIEFLGRLDHQVKIRGQRIELEEIEAALAAHPAIEAAVAQVRGEAQEDQRLVAYVVPADAVPSEELRAVLRLRLPSYMIPDIIVGLNALPLLANGKLDRRNLPEPERVRDPFGPPHASPQSRTENALARIWGDLLGLPWVGCLDDFFDLGGHSLLALRVLNRIRDKFGLDLPLGEFFECRTVASLAQRIDTLLQRGHGPVIAPPHSVSRDRRFPLTFSQEQLWFLEQLTPGLTAYNIPVVLRLRGAINQSALRSSLDFLTQRHEVLRSTFPAPEGIPSQVMHPTCNVALRVTDLASSGRGPSEEEIAAWLAKLARTSFDLESGPLWSADLILVREKECVLCFVFHHMIFDGWSVGPFVADLTLAYNACARDRRPSMEPLRLHEADYAVWQHDLYARERLEQSLAFWREMLSGAPPQLTLPFDHPRATALGFQGNVVCAQAPRETARKLRELGRSEGTTLYSALLTLWHLLLKRYSGQNDIVTGSAIAGRDWTELEPAVGFFVNTVVLRTNVAEDVTLGEAIRDTHGLVMKVREHQHTSLKKIVETVCPERDAARSPLFQVAFVLQNMPPVGVSFEGMKGTHVYVHNGGAKFDLLLEVDERGEDLELRLEYNTGLFERATAQRILGQYERLLEAAISRPTARLCELDMMPELERRQILIDFNRTAVEYPLDASIPELFEAVAERFGESVALCSDTESMTYAALNARANQVAAFLRDEGVGRDVLVGLCVERSIDALVTILGILKAGGAYLPLDPDYPEARLRQVLEDAQPILVIVDDAEASRMHGETAKVFSLGNLREAVECYPVGNAAQHPGPRDLAYVMFTSGSTGIPKGVCVAHRNIVRLVRGASYASFGPQEVFLQFAPLPFDASTFEIWGALLHGARLAIAPAGPLSLEQLATVIEREHVTTAWLTAGLFHQAVDTVLERLGGLRQLLAGGDVLSPAHVRRVLEALPGIRLVNGYGPTECTTFACCHPMCGPDEAEDPVPIGRPIANTRVYVLDECMNPVPVGAVGELYIGGDGVARGYLNRPELTAERFVPCPFEEKPGAVLYRTGDEVRFLPDGRLQFLGRKDQQVKIRGFRVEPGEIEAVLTATPWVKDAVVVAQADTSGDKRLVAYVTPRQTGARDSAAVRDFLGAQLPGYMIPSIIVWVEALPLNANGKVDRNALPVPAQSEERAYSPPATELERVLADIWMRLLKVERVGRDEDFFALGGHSLIATQMVYQIQDVFGIQFPLRKVFECGTVAALAEAVEEAVIELVEGSGSEES